MTVRELRKFLETCDQNIQVTVIAPDDELGFSICYGVANVKQIKPYSLFVETATEIIRKRFEGR